MVCVFSEAHVRLWVPYVANNLFTTLLYLLLISLSFVESGWKQCWVSIYLAIIDVLEYLLIFQYSKLAGYTQYTDVSGIVVVSYDTCISVVAWWLIRC